MQGERRIGTAECQVGFVERPDGADVLPVAVEQVDLDSPRADRRGENLAAEILVVRLLQHLQQRVPIEQVDAHVRQAVAAEIGWDFLATLENAYVPLTTALNPGDEEDWLYTGRAFAFTPLPVSAGWISIVREDFGIQTYWRVYLRARFQDGSVGMPLCNPPWDFNARYSGDTVAYEQGGALSHANPTGYGAYSIP